MIDDKPKYNITYAATGLGLGFTLGVIFDKVAIGTCGGIVLGSLIDIIRYHKKKKNEIF